MHVLYERQKTQVGWLLRPQTKKEVFNLKWAGSHPPQIARYFQGLIVQLFVNMYLFCVFLLVREVVRQLDDEVERVAGGVETHAINNSVSKWILIGSKHTKVSTPWK